VFARMLSLQEAVRLISSDKAKERSEGIELYKDIFQNPQTLQDLSEGDDDGRRWLRTMQALFTCVQIDKSAVMKKGLADAAPISIRRLKESAHMVQWTVEKACSYFPHPAFISVFNHLTQSLDDRGYVFEPLAADYLKALRMLLNHRPHMDHLDVEKWTRVTACCFNILLNDSMDRELEDGEAKNLFASDEEDGNTSQRVSRVLDAEVTSCLQILVMAPNAPLIGPSHLCAHVLDRYASFLLDYPLDSTAHLPALQGLNHVLSEMEINESLLLRRFAAKVWPAFLALWSTKSRQLKEQVIISMHILVPLFVQRSEYTEHLSSLQKKLLDEPDQRFALQPLALTSIELCSNLKNSAFQYKTLRARRGLSAADSQAWAAIEMTADCTLSLYNVKEEAALPEPDEAGQRPTKKLKQANGNAGDQSISDVVQVLVDRAGRGARGHDGKSLQLWSLQILLFVSLRHMRQEIRNDEWISKALPIITELLSNTDLEIQSWSLLILATLTPSPILQLHCKQIWPTVCRRVMQSGTSRAASHAAEAILISGAVPKRETLHELQSLIDDLESQGLSYGFDSVCGFLSRAVTLMSKDLTAARNKPGEKVLAWLQSTAWSTQDKESRSKTCGEMRASADVVSLLSAICGFESISPWSRAIMQLPVTPVVIRLRQAAMTEEMKAFVSTCTIPQQGAQGVQSGASKAQSVDGVKRSPKSIEVRSLNYIQKTLKAHLNQMREAISASSIVLDHVSKAVDCAVVALLFDGSLQENRIASQTHLVDLAHELLELSLQSIVQSRWTSADIAFVMTSLKPLLDDDKGARVLSFELIQSPGKLAGIETEVLLDLAREEEADKIHILADKLTSLWRSTRSKTLMLAFQKLYDRVMHATPTEAAKTAREQDDDIWAGIAPKGAQQEALYEISQGPNEESTTRVCISAMLALSLSSKSDLGGSALVKKYIVSSESSVPFLLLSGSLIFEKTSKGELSFIMEELEEVLQTIGDDLLADYKYERTVEAQLVALDFLDGTLSQWSAPSQADDFFLKKALKVCVYFVKQFSKGALLWRVEERLGRFLEHFIKSAMQENSPLREVKSPVLEIETLIKSLLTLNGRPDIRVRWSATTMTARLYEIWAQLGFNTLVLYEHTIPLLSMETDVAEQMATRILVIGNALVASSPARHSALYHLIELALVEDNFHDHLCVVLGLTSKLLGFSSVSDLWLLYVTQITWAIINNGYSLEGLPFRVLGYKNQAEMLQQSFQRIASMLVAIGTDSALESLQTLSSLAGKTQKEASIECIPSLVATDLAVLTHVEDVKEAFNTMANGMVSRLQMKGKEGLPLVKKVMSATLDTIIAGILRLFYEPDLKLFADFLSLQDPNCTLLLESVEGLTDRNIHEPCLPQNSGKTVHRSITVMASQMKETFSGPTVYGVIHQMISLIHRERLVNDQHRHIQGLKLYLCLAQKTIEDNAAVIRLLVHSCAVLVGHVDLVDAIWPLLDWVVDLVKLHIPGLSSSLIVLLRHARHFSRSNHTFIQQVGVRLSERLGRLVLRLKESKQGKIAALETICAWPSGYPLTLNDREYTINISKLSNALQATGSISAAFLQRISRAVQRADADEVTEFCSSTVWMILDRLDKEDIDDEERGQIAATFADLLHYCNGRISSPSSTTSFFNLANRKGALTAISRIDTRSQQPLQPLKSWLTRQLVSMSRSAQLDSAEAAVACVRAICTQDPHFAGSTRMDWDPLDAEELRLITFFPNTARNRKKRSRTELETDEAILKATQHDSWMVWICSLLCDILAERVEGASFGPLSEMVSKQISFAKDSFSIILHIFLRSDLQFKEASRKNTQSLSRHLNAVLRRQETDKEVWKAIIQAIVQLRNDDPTETPLACDQWIQGIDFFVLQRRAAQCHLYATAILFAELEHQYREGDISEVDPETRLLLQYDIYSNIEDPDSFYGIKNSDVRHSLVNRLQHEGQWDRLFDLYAAQNESTSSVKGLATTLHHQGFNRLALQMDEKQTTSYSAAWRMGKWDLPIDRLEAGTSQSLYSALRAIHSEKDESVAKGNLQRAFESEYNGLAMANLEANRAARSNARDLLGLREISLWQAKANVSLSRLSDQFE
jgi:ataxia telangiectasia mutated family protein